MFCRVGVGAVWSGVGMLASPRWQINRSVHARRGGSGVEWCGDACIAPVDDLNRCKNTILSEHYARWSTYFLSWDVESTVSRFLGRDVRNDVEYDQPA
jgi:hypothetical protein